MIIQDRSLLNSTLMLTLYVILHALVNYNIVAFPMCDNPGKFLKLNKNLGQAAFKSENFVSCGIVVLQTPHLNS